MHRSRRPWSAVPLLTLLACTPSSTPPPQGFRAVEFPASFSFGVAMAQWQVCGDEGVNGPVRSNWGEWVDLGHAKDGQRNPRGNGFCADYAGDLDRAQALGVDTIRLGIDWSRVEPEPDVFNDAELDHFVGVLEAIRARGMKPVLTLYHWNVPLWVQNPNPDLPGGTVDMLSDGSRVVVDHFEEFVRRVIPRVKQHVDIYTAINEPFSMLAKGYVQGEFPPGRLLDFERATRYGGNMVFMHARAFDVIKELDDADMDGDGVSSFVGLTMAAFPVYPLDENNPRQQFAAENINYIVHDWVMQALTEGKLDVDLDGQADNTTTNPPEGIYPELQDRLEFVGVQYYGVIRVSDDPLFVDLPPMYGLPVFDVKQYAPELPHNGMGVAISAAGFRDMLERYGSYGIPIIITEAGTTTNGVPVYDMDGNFIREQMQHEQAAMLVTEHLWEMARAMKRGADVRGFYLWTLADNFEWVEGHHQRFGAYTVDFGDPAMPRTLSRMGEAFRDVVQARGINEELWKRYVLEKYPTDQRAEGGLTTSEPVYGVLD